MNKKITLTFLLAVFCQPVYAMDYVKSVGSLAKDHKYAVALGAFSCLRSYTIHRNYKDSFAAMKKCAQETSDGWDINRRCSMYYRQSVSANKNLEKIKNNDLHEIRDLINKYVEDGEALTCYIDTTTTLQNVDDMEIGVLRNGKDVVIVLNQLALECLHKKNGFTPEHFESIFIHEAAHINENHSQKKMRIKIAQPIVDLFVSCFGYHISDSYFKLPSYASILIATAAYGISYKAQNFSSLVYSRYLERRADAAVFKTQDKNKIENYKDLLKKTGSWGDQEDVPSIFSTHPSLKERIAACDRALEELQSAVKR